MGCFPRLLACATLLAGSACAADRVTAPAVPTPKVRTSSIKAPEDGAKSQRVDLTRQSKAIAADAVWVVDGVIMMREDALRLVDTSDIVSVEVVKDAAHGLYGPPRDAIVVTTKRGREP